MKEFLNLTLNQAFKLRWVLAALVLLLAGLARPAQAQITTTDPTLNNPAAPIIVRPDTATVRKLSKKDKRARAAADSAKRTERLFGFHVTRPEKAGFLALIPGTGQIYNRKFWKLPIVYGMVGGLGYWVWYQQRYYSSIRFANTQYQNAPATGLTTTQIGILIGDASSEIPDANLRAQLATVPATTISNALVGARRYRDLSILLSALGYSLQILDAVVDAHLYDFDVSDNLSLNWQPVAIPLPGQLLPAPGLSVALRLK
ncbi:MAG: DUF5683 domain-containing protein [Janthinobacterium lividum]